MFQFHSATLINIGNFINLGQHEVMVRMRDGKTGQKIGPEENIFIMLVVKDHHS